MYTKSFFSNQLSFIKLLMIAFVCLATFSILMPSASAQVINTDKMPTNIAFPKPMTASDLQALILKLQAQLKALNSTIATTSAPFEVGMRVDITDVIRVRAKASVDSMVLGVQKAGATGVITEGPVRLGGYTWVKVDYESGPDGWNVSNWLRNKSNFEGEVTLPTTCTNDGKTYKQGETIKLTHSSSTTIIGYLTGEGKAQYKCAGGKWKLADSESEKTYTYADTLTITKRSVDPDTAMADEEYTLYVITLKTGRKIEVKIYGRTVAGTTEAAFRKTGYIGSVEYLMERAKELKPVVGGTPEPDPAPVPEPAPTAPTAPTSTKPRPQPAPVSPDEAIGTVIKGSCVSGDKTYKVGTKLQTITVEGKTKSIMDASFVCRATKWEVEGSLPAGKGNFTLDDVKTVTFKIVNTSVTNPEGSMLGGGYRLYEITLKDKTVKKVKASSSSDKDAEKAFRDAGFTGNIAKLKAMAKPAAVVKGASTDILGEISVTLDTIAGLLNQIK